MTHLLPPNLLRLFVSRPALPHGAALPGDRDIVHRTSRQQRSRRPLEGVAAFLERVKQEAADKGQATEGQEGDEEPTDAAYVSLEKRREEKKRHQEEYRKEAEASYDPQKDPNAEGDPFKTLFISRLSYEATEADLNKEFGIYGPIEHLKLVKDKEGKSRGYAFIVYEREKDMRTAYKDADGLKIRGRRILVDVERGRTVKGWKPMRLGGGLGASQSSRKKKEPEPEAPQGFGMRGGFRGRGGFAGRGAPMRGGFRGGPPGVGGFGSRGGYGGAPRGGYGSSAPMGGPPRAAPYGSGGGYGGAPPMGYGAPRGGGYGGGGGSYGGGGYGDGPPAKRGRY
ncbi:unnamed protein product [Parajaminaea phylloscopi]